MRTTTNIKIRGYHIDQFGHVNNARYLEFLEEGRWDYMESNSLIFAFHSNNLQHSVVSILINYRKSAFSGQIISVETGLLKKTRQSIIIQQQLYLKNTEILIADAEITNVFQDSRSGNIVPVNENLYETWPALSELPEETKQ